MDHASSDLNDDEVAKQVSRAEISEHSEMGFQGFEYDFSDFSALQQSNPLHNPRWSPQSYV